MKKCQLKRVLACLFFFCVLAANVVTINVFAKEKSKQELQSISADNAEERGYDIVFCIDNSRSVWNQQEIRNEALRCIANLAVGSDIRIGGVYFARDVYSELNLTSMNDQAGSETVLNDFLKRTDRDSGNIDTNIGVALQAARRLLENQDSKRKQIVVLFSDGINENSLGSRAFKNSADALTEEQAKMMEGKIDLYCVYLQKSRNNEGYLKELVNYFNPANTYDKTRFKSVSEKDINTLSGEFAKVFYDVQNGMKYREIRIDSTGKTTFYVPAIGIGKVQIYLNKNDDTPLIATLTCMEEDNSEQDAWEDGKNAYFSIKNPTVGQWEMALVGDDFEKITGTIAYYVDMQCATELVSVSGEKEYYKNSEVKLRSTFYDSTRKKMKLDESVEVNGYFISTNSTGEKNVKKVPMTASKGYYESESFTIDNYGTFVVGANVVFEDYVDLQYSMNEGTIEVQPPKAKNKTAVFAATKKGEKYHFTIKEEKIITDPEGEKLTLVSVTQGNPDNIVSVEQKDDAVVVELEKTGRVEFALEFSDESGAVATVLINGIVQEKVVRQMEDIFVLLVILILIVNFIVKNVQMKKIKKNIKGTEVAIAQVEDQIQELVGEANAKYVIGDDAEQKKLCKDIQEACSDEFIWQCFGLSECMNYDPADTEGFIRKIQETKEFIREKKEQIDDFEMRKCKLKELKKLQAIPEYVKKVVNEHLEGLKQCFNDFSQNAPLTRQRLKKSKENLEELKKMMKGNIQCTLRVNFGDGQYRGVMLSNVVAGDSYYRLDEDVDMRKIDGTISKLCNIVENMPKLLVTAYMDDDNIGLTLRSNEQFQIKEEAVDGGYEEVRGYHMEQNGAYLVDTESGVIKITVQ